MAKKYYMVLDTETVADARVPYDIAWIIIDRQGNKIEEFNGLCGETLENPTLRYILRHDDFAKRKAGFYLDNPDMNNLAMPFAQIWARTNAAIAKYHCPVVAYNAAFDVKVLNNYSQALLGLPFFNDAVVWDLWTMALNTICDSSNYVRWCQNANFVKENGNICSTAESVYSYLSGNMEFAEDHTALSDCEIEAQILVKVFSRRQKLETAMCMPITKQKVWKNRLKSK